jgi:hypothetical protein
MDLKVQRFHRIPRQLFIAQNASTCWSMDFDLKELDEDFTRGTIEKQRILKSFK